MHVSDTELVDFLVSTGAVSRRAINEAVAEAERADRALDHVLLTRGLLGERELRRAESYLLGVPFVDLRNEPLDMAVLALIPEPVAREHGAVAYRRSGDTLEVAFLDLRAVPEVKRAETQGLAIVPRLTDLESHKHALTMYRDALRREYGDQIECDMRELGEGADEGRAVRVLETVLAHARLLGASHIHIEPTDSSARVRYRLGGVLRDAMVLPASAARHLASCAKRLTGLDQKTALPQDGTFSSETGPSVRLRILPTAHGEKLMMRVLSESASGFTLESLGLAGRALEALEEALHKREGLIVAAGPRESGKSTFLYTVLDIVARPDKNLVSVEDPVEYVMRGVSQMQVDAAHSLTHARAMRAAAAHNADVLMTSDLPDAESARVAVAAALSGELVLAGFGAESAADALTRLVERGMDAKLLSSALSAVVGMRTVRRLGPDRERYTLTRDELGLLGQMVSLDRLLERMKEEGAVAQDAIWEKIPFYKPRKGVRESLAYQGRIGLFEVIPATPRVRELVANSASRTSITHASHSAGQLSLLEDGIMKAVAGLTTLEEVLRAAA